MRSKTMYLGLVLIAFMSGFHFHGSMTTSSNQAYAQTSLPRVALSNLVYQGAFRVPQGSTDQTSFDYGGTALGYNPANNSLFMVGHSWYQRTAEINIPNVVNSTTITSLNTATLRQPFADATEGKVNQVNPSDPNSKGVGGHMVYGGKLYISAGSYYDAGGTQSSSHFARPINLSTTGQVTGPVRVGNLYPGFVSGYMTQIPSEWQSLFGGPALTGNCCLPIVSVQSNGPAASVFNPNNIDVLNPVPATPIVGYPHSNPLAVSDTTNPYYNGTTHVAGIVFPSGTRSILFFGRHGVGTSATAPVRSVTIRPTAPKVRMPIPTSTKSGPMMRMISYREKWNKTAMGTPAVCYMEFQPSL